MLQRLKPFKHVETVSSLKFTASQVDTDTGFEAVPRHQCARARRCATSQRSAGSGRRAEPIHREVLRRARGRLQQTLAERRQQPESGTLCFA